MLGLGCSFNHAHLQPAWFGLALVCLQIAGLSKYFIQVLAGVVEPSYTLHTVTFSLLLFTTQWLSGVAKHHIGFYSRPFAQCLYSHARGFYSQRAYGWPHGFRDVAWLWVIYPLWNNTAGTPSCHFRLSEAEVVG